MGIWVNLKKSEFFFYYTYAIYYYIIHTQFRTDIYTTYWRKRLQIFDFFLDKALRPTKNIITFFSNVPLLRNNTKQN